MSDAVGLDRISAIVGYKIVKGSFQESSPNLPQRVMVFGEANAANQSGLSTDPVEYQTAGQVGDAFGYGSPLYQIMRILQPISGGGLGGIPIEFYPQAEPAGAAAKIIEVTPTGTATANGTHIIKISGRGSIDGESYAIGITSGDDEDAIVAKIADVVNNVLRAPMTAVANTGAGANTELTSKWKGLTADSIVVEIDTQGNDLGLSYAVASAQSGAGEPTVAGSLAKVESKWNTIAINSYGLSTAVMTEFESWNGIANPVTPTGRYNGEIMKPTIVLSGSTEATAATLAAVTDARKLNHTIVVAPAPNSKGMHFEAAANACAVLAPQAQNNPHLDTLNMLYPDMPTPDSIGDMADYNQRDFLVKKGCSTVDLVSGFYQIKDLVTTYHPDGETPPAYRYVRTFMIDMNVRYGYYLLEQTHVVGKAIAENEDTVSVSNVIKPKDWIQILKSYADDLGARGLIAEKSFMQDNINVGISTINPNRLETEFKYKRSGFTRIAATTAVAGFNFGTNS